VTLSPDAQTPSSEPTRSHRKLATLWACAAALIIVANLVCAFRTWQTTQIAVDDAFISYRYADNLVHGNGLVWNPGERVEGYSNFLWVLFSAAAMAMGRDPLSATRGLGVVSYLAVVATCGALLAWRLRTQPWHHLLLLGSLSLLVLPTGLAAMAGTGLETFFVTLLLLWLGITQHVHPPRSRPGQWASALVPLLACLTRLDALCAVAASVTTLVLGALSREQGASEIARLLARRYGAFAAGMLVYLGWKLAYYGSLLPNTYYAKLANAWSVSAGLEYLKVFFQNSPQTIALSLLALAAVGRAIRRSTFGQDVYLGLTLLFYTLYIVKVGGDFMYWRFAFEVFPLLFLLALDGVLATRPAAAVGFGLVVALALLSMSPSHLEQKYNMQALGTMNKYTREGTEVGQRLRQVLLADTRIATTLAGTVPFYSRLFTIDQWGLNDWHVAHLSGFKLVTRGHIKRAPIEYIESRGVNLYFAHPMVCSCANPCGENIPNVFVRLGGDRCVRSWYMVQNDRLTGYFCRHPEWFVLTGVSCPQ
jgi:hypothetical protein